MSSETNEQLQQQPTDVTSLQESFLQQQEKITALRELVRKSGAAHGSSKSAAKEKVKNIAERLQISKAKSKQGLNASTYSTEAECSKPTESMVNTSTPNPTPIKQPILYFTPGSEKIALMRQQLEENKIRMAQKASSKQHLEQLVSQLKEKFDNTQQCLEDASALGKSMSDLSNLMHIPVNRDRHKSATDLCSQSFSLEKERIKFLENRCRLLEKQLEKEKQFNNNRGSHDFENRIKELEESLVRKEKEIAAKESRHREELEQLESKSNISCTQENKEIDNLKEQLSRLTEKNEELLQEIEKLSNIRDQQKDCSENVNENIKLKEELQELQKHLDSSSNNPMNINDLMSENDRLKSEIDDHLKCINELTETNDILETTRRDLASKNTQLLEQNKQLQEDIIVSKQKLKCSEEKCAQLELLNEHSKNPDTDSQIKAEMAKQIQELMDEITEVKCENRKLQDSIRDNSKFEVNDSSIAEKISSLEATIESQREETTQLQVNLKKYEEELMEKTIEFNVLNANFKVLEEQLEKSSKAKPLFSSTSTGSQDSNTTQLEAENQQLKQKLDESNKAMIKLKLKCKQTEKQIEKLKKASDLHSEVVKLNMEKDVLQQRLTELEDEKGQWQLTQMESSDQCCKHETSIHDYENKIASLSSALKEMETQLDAIKQGEQTRVTSELIEIQLEEQVKEQTKEIISLRNELENKEKCLKSLNEHAEEARQQKEELDKKLEHYLHENMELLEKVEKLSKSSSSAESIEIVERLTQQEKQELEEFNKRLEIGDCSVEAPLQKDAVNELTQTEMNPEISESLNKLREESSELMSKIELFTTERREVLEKMEHLNAENQELLQRLGEITTEKENLATELSLTKTKQDDLMLQLEAANKEKEALNVQIAESKSHKNQLSQELTSLQQSSEVMAALDNSETLFDKCEKSLSKLSCELEAYRKAHDKKSKFNVSKKLAKEAENAHSQLSELLQKVKEASSAVETVTVVETVVAVTASNGKALAEYEQLTAQNRELKATVAELRTLLDEARDAQDEEADIRPVDERPAIKLDIEKEEKLKEANNRIAEYEGKLIELQSRVEDLSRELHEAQNGVTERTEEISKLSDEIERLRKLSDDFDRLVNNKEMHHEKQIEQITRLRKELESKCDTYEQEIEILQTLVAEQKQQLIEAYKEHEHEMNVKLLALQQQEQLAREMREEIAELKRTSAIAGVELNTDLQSECEKLREALKINKHLAQQQVEELSNKQETIDTLNQQIIDLYKSMEEGARKLIEKEDEICYVQELYDNNKIEKDKLELKLKEIESINQQLKLAHEECAEKMKQYQATSEETLMKNQELDQHNKEQLQKLKKYAANLKKKALQCQDLEKQLKESQTKADDTDEIKQLRAANIDLQQQLDNAKKELSAEVEKHVDIVNVRNVLEQEVKQLQLVVDQKQSSIEALKNSLKDVPQMAKSLDWAGESFDADQLQQELLTGREDINVKNQEIYDLKMSLSAAYGSIALFEKQLVEAENIRSEFQTAQNTISKLETELQAARQEAFEWGDTSQSEQLREELACSQENFRLKVKEIEELRQSLMAAQEQQTAWGNESSIKNADYVNLSKVLSDKSVRLENAEALVEELEKEVMILREKYRESQQQIHDLQTALTAQNQQSAESEGQKMHALTEELKAKSLKFEKSKAVIKERNGQIQRLQAQLKDLQEKLSLMPEEEESSPTTETQLTVQAQLEASQQEYRKLYDTYVTEKSNFEKTISRLEALHDGIQAKLQEDMAYIESLEQENAKFKDKICRLQDCVASFEERRASMERKVNIMDAQLQTRSEEHAKAEDELIYRLNMLSEHDEVIAQRLIDSQSDREEIEENFRKLQTDFNILQTKYNKLEREYGEFKTESSQEFEQELVAVREQLSKAESDLERQKSAYDGKLAAKVTELDELECELSDQLQKMNAEKKELNEQIERMTDECSSHQNEMLRLQENLNTLDQAKTELERELSWLRMQSESSQQDLFELQEMRMQSMQDKTEIENLRHQIESLASNHENELQALRTQIAELDTLRMQVGQNQTDDQVFIETENKRLTDLLAEKEAVIDNYQRQNLQLQMAASAANSATTSQTDPFSLSLGLPPPTQPVDVLEAERLRHDLNEKTALLSRLQQDFANLQTEFNVVVESNQEMQHRLMGPEMEASNFQTLQRVASALSEAQSNDVIPAPPMFFTTEVHSPFDDIIQSQHGEDALAPSGEQPTIEDLQRNVSDLEKHAQDLEHKLAMRNQREAEYEERLNELEIRLKEKDHAHNQIKIELQTIQVDLQHQIRHLEHMLQTKDQELRALQDEQRRILEEEALKKTVVSVEKQIVENPGIQPTLDMFFGNAPSQEFEPFLIPETSTEPVVEDIIIPKKTYECHPEKQTAVIPAPEIADASLDIGDGWGDSWGNNDAAAEAEYFAKQTSNAGGQVSLVPREQVMELQIQELNERLQDLQLSLDRSEDQKKELHIKSGKLMKKLKEYKTKMDEMQSTASSAAFRKSSSIESNSMFGDLDAAIQEEMKNQIKSLESRLEEQMKVYENLNAEKEKLLQRIDMLTLGNERMAEMKERQDMEVQMYQSRIRELQQKLESLDDWGNEDASLSVIDAGKNQKEETPSGSITDLQKRVADLTLEVQDLNGDRLELQDLLEEEKLNTQRAEQTLASLRLHLSALEEEKSNADNTHLNNLKIELQNLRDSYNNLMDVNNKLSTDFKSQSDTLLASQTNELRLQTELDALQAEVENLRETLVKTKQGLIDLEAELSALKQQKEKQLDAAISGDNQHKSEDVTQDIENLKSKIEVLEETVRQLSEENELLKKIKPSEALENRLKTLEHENTYLKQVAGSSFGEDLSVELQEKESEIMHLKQRINDLMNEDQTEKLVLEILTKNQEIHMLKMEVKNLEDDKHELQNNLSLQLTKEMQASKEIHKGNEAQPKGVEELESLKAQVNELLTEKKQMEEELQVLNNHVLESLQQEETMKALTLELDTKNIQISELRNTIESLRNSGSDESANYAAISSQWEAVVEQKCGEIAKMWQEHLNLREEEFKLQEQRLREEINILRSSPVTGVSIEPMQKIVALETTPSSTPASESTTASGSTSAEASLSGTPLRIRSDTGNDEDNADAIIEKMQSALESQEMEIVTLKEQLAIRSAEYARLAAQYDPFKLQNTMSHIGVVESRKFSAHGADVATVPKSELDLAMYMLHQRDMRCEEMTLELVSLLEERDTLQLKLSNTLRQVELIKSQTGVLSQESSSAGPSVSKAVSENTNISVAGSTVKNADDELIQKLSQLHTVSHSKDKVIKEEREQRSRQLENLQQDVAKMPPAAVSELLGTDMSQSNQSPSTALLNWLWGNKSGNSASSQPDF